MKMAGTANPVLNQSNLGGIGSHVQKPKYSLDKVGIGIVHIGPGKFFGGHLAMYVNALLNQQGGGNWGISAVSIRRPGPDEIEKARAEREVQAQQDHLFTLLERSKNSARLSIMGSVRERLAAYDEPQKVMDRLCARGTKVVSMTITPNSYSDALLDQTLKDPQNWVGYVLAALLRRKQEGIPPFTLLSCDNISGNGDKAKHHVIELAERVCPEEVEWLKANLRAPNTMVDRITPAITPQDRKYIEDATGHSDASAVVCETFHQFVIENNLGEGFPPLDKVPGVSIVQNVTPYESMKLRQLNGSHRAIAYIGFMLDLKFVHEAFDPRNPTGLMLGKFIAAMMEDEMLPGLPEIADYTPEQRMDYINTLLSRFSDHVVGDSVARIGENGATKLNNRIFDPMRAQLASGGEMKRLAFAAAVWIRYISGVREDRVLYDIADKYAKAQGISEASQKIYEDYVASDRTKIDISPILAFEEVFGKDLPQNTVFVEAVASALKSVYDKGVAASLAEFMPTLPPSGFLPLTHNGLALKIKQMQERERAA